jgi:hypothetical protein
MAPPSRTRRLSPAEQASMRRRDDAELRRRDTQTEAILAQLAQGGSGRPMVSQTTPALDAYQGQLNDVLPASQDAARVTTASKFRLQDFGENIGGRRFNQESGKMDSPYFKGLGYFGPLENAAGDSMTEWSRDESLWPDSPLIQYPLLVPKLSQDQVRWILNKGFKGNTNNDPSWDRIMSEINGVAADHARMRISQGLSPFASKGEENRDLYRNKMTRREGKDGP